MKLVGMRVCHLVVIRFRRAHALHAPAGANERKGLYASGGWIWSRKGSGAGGREPDFGDGPSLVLSQEVRFLGAKASTEGRKRRGGLR